MNSRDAASTYHQSTAVGASPVGNIVALYDTILRDFHRALAAIDSGDIAARVNATNHALLVIGELQGVLDFARGGDAARHLNSFYIVMRALLTEAGVTASREKFLDLSAKFARLRSAWSQAENRVAPAALSTPRHTRESSTDASAFNSHMPPPAEGSENSVHGWKA